MTSSPERGTPPPALYTPDELSAYLGVPKKTLEFWRSTGSGPPFVRFGRSIRYPGDLLVSWMRETAVYGERKP